MLALNQTSCPFLVQIIRVASICLTFLLSTHVVHSSVVHASEQEAEPLLSQAEKYYEDLEYEKSLQLLIKVQQIPGITPIQQARCFLYMGVAFTALGRAENAVQAFVEVLKLRPDFRLPEGVSPSIRAMFSQAMKRLGIAEGQAPGGAAQPGQPQPQPTPGAAAGGGQVQVMASTSPRISAGKPIEVDVGIKDPTKSVRAVVLRWRHRGDAKYSNIKLDFVPGTPTLAGKIPVSAMGTDAGQILFFVEARAANGKVLGTDGAEDDPQSVMIVDNGYGKKKEKSTWHWWALGIGGGAAVIAGAVLAGVMLSKSGGGNDNPKLTIVIE